MSCHLSDAGYRRSLLQTRKKVSLRFFIGDIVIVLFRGNRYGERVQLGSIPELSMEEADNLQNLENFSVWS